MGWGGGVSDNVVIFIIIWSKRVRQNERAEDKIMPIIWLPDSPCR